jgi:hypothetical protein
LSGQPLGLARAARNQGYGKKTWRARHDDLVGDPLIMAARCFCFEQVRVGIGVIARTPGNTAPLVTIVLALPLLRGIERPVAAPRAERPPSVQKRRPLPEWAA